MGTGANTKTFYVHRDLLSFYSGYFEAALNGGFAEAGSGIMKLETEEPAVFEGFVKWLYTAKARTDEITKQNAGEYFKSIVRLWIFADRRDVPLLMNEMIDSLHRSVVAIWIIPNNSVKEIYDNTTEGSALRRVLVDMYASVAGDELAGEFTPDNDVYTKGFLCDLVKSMIATVPRRPFLKKEQYQKVEMCPSFHVHEEGVKCAKRGTKRSSNEMEK